MMRKSLLFIGLLALAQPLAAQTPSTPGDANGNFLGRSRGSGLKGFLTPEQQVMWLRQNGKQADRQGRWEQEQARQLGGMSETQRLKLQTRLQKAWDDLPNKQKDRLHGQIAERMNQQNAGLH